MAYLVKREENRSVPAEAMIELRLLSPDGVLEIPDKPHQIGDKVKAIAGLFKGDTGNVTQLIPSRQRIKVLFEILGRATEIEINEHEESFQPHTPSVPDNLSTTSLVIAQRLVLLNANDQGR